MSRNVNFEDFASRKSHEPILVIEDEEQEDLKVELGSPKTPVVSNTGQQPSGEKDGL